MGIIASIPVLINGVYGFKNNEVAAKVSGGFGVGCSIPGVLGAGICTIVCLIGIAGQASRMSPSATNTATRTWTQHRATMSVRNRSRRRKYWANILLGTSASSPG